MGKDNEICKICPEKGNCDAVDNYIKENSKILEDAGTAFLVALRKMGFPPIITEAISSAAAHDLRYIIAERMFGKEAAERLYKVHTGQGDGDVKVHVVNLKSFSEFDDTLDVQPIPKHEYH